jgi:hypothetical protein
MLLPIRSTLGDRKITVLGLLRPLFWRIQELLPKVRSGSKGVKLTATLCFLDCPESGPSTAALTAAGRGLARIKASRIEAGLGIVIQSP